MEIRCNYCGWDNPVGVEVCEKCHKPLQMSPKRSVSSSESAMSEKATRRKTEGDVDILKATISESRYEAERNKVVVKKCPECGYELEDGTCSNCGYTETLKYESIEHASVDPMKNVKATQRPDRKNKKERNKSRFVLTPISEAGDAEGDLLDFAGASVSLNRNNTDPNNSTITSQVQAVVTNEDGKWFIEDKSELKTTLVRASRKIELQNGDWILLGNQLFRFDDITY